MDIKYSIDVEKIINEVNLNGFSKLPPLKNFIDLDMISDEMSKSIGSRNFQENNTVHKKVIKDLGLHETLIPRLYEHSINELNYKGDIDNQYLVTRKVNPGDKESFRAHFDSHLYTIVLPIKIPTKIEDKNCGDLIYFPNIRKNPSNDIINLLGKIYYKKYASKESLSNLMKKSKYEIENFNNYQPLLFRGNTFLHTNFNLDSCYEHYRMTCLVHLFDPFKNFGIGSLIRKIRTR